MPNGKRAIDLACRLRLGLVLRTWLFGAFLERPDGGLECRCPVLPLAGRSRGERRRRAGALRQGRQAAGTHLYAARSMSAREGRLWSRLEAGSGKSARATLLAGSQLRLHVEVDCGEAHVSEP